MHEELKPYGVEVVTVTPGAYRTGFNDTGIESMDQWWDRGERVVEHWPVRDDRRDGVADDVAGGDGDRQEPVDPEDQREAFDRERSLGRDGGGEDHERAAGNRRRALRGEQHDCENPDLLAPAHISGTL